MQGCFKRRRLQRHAASLIASLAIASSWLAAGSSPVRAQGPARLTPTELRAALDKPDAATSDALVARIKELAAGEAGLQKGMPPRTDNKPEGLTVAWAIEAPGVTPGQEPEVYTDDPHLRALRLQRVGNSDVYAAAVLLPVGLAGHWSYHVGGKEVSAGQYEDYPVNVEEIARPDVPKGTVTQMPPWRSKIFEGTSRNWWVYVPAQYKGDKPIGFIVCQDGGGPRNWLPTILDNMIAKGDLPPLAAVFIDPGTFDDKRSDRSIEYDTLSDKYAQMLIQEILPEVQKTVKLSANPDDRALYGVSSGGICAFTVAWEHPEAFHKVDTCVGSFTNLQGGPTGTAGGNTYPAIIRHYAGWGHEGKPKPIKMYQTDGANDLDNAAGNWPLCNEQIAKALDYGGYTHKFVFGNGFHGDRFGRYNMPAALRYLWSDQK